jgi:hypothetical protein
MGSLVVAIVQLLLPQDLASVPLAVAFGWHRIPVQAVAVPVGYLLIYLCSFTPIPVWG